MNCDNHTKFVCFVRVVYVHNMLAYVISSRTCTHVACRSEICAILKCFRLALCAAPFYKIKNDVLFRKKKKQNNTKQKLKKKKKKKTIPDVDPHVKCKVLKHRNLWREVKIKSKLLHFVCLFLVMNLGLLQMQ